MRSLGGKLIGGLFGHLTNSLLGDVLINALSQGIHNISFNIITAIF